MLSFQLCHEDDVRLFAFIIPDIYSQVASCAIHRNACSVSKQCI